MTHKDMAFLQNAMSKRNDSPNSKNEMSEASVKIQKVMVKSYISAIL